MFFFFFSDRLGFMHCLILLNTERNLHALCILLLLAIFLWNGVMGRKDTGPLCDKNTSIIKLMWCSVGGSYCIW